MIVAVVGWNTKCCISHLCKTSQKCPPVNSAVADIPWKGFIRYDIALLLFPFVFFSFFLISARCPHLYSLFLEEYILFIFIEFEFFVYWFYGDVQLVLYLKVPLQLGTTATIKNKFIYFFIVFLLGVGGGNLSAVAGK